MWNNLGIAFSVMTNPYYIIVFEKMYLERFSSLFFIEKTYDPLDDVHFYIFATYMKS